jgi:hypothetical protein
VPANFPQGPPRFARVNVKRQPTFVLCRLHLIQRNLILDGDVLAVCGKIQFSVVHTAQPSISQHLRPKRRACEVATCVIIKLEEQRGTTL